jgi:hypothetical protein
VYDEVVARFFVLALAVTSSCGLFPSLDGLSGDGGVDVLVGSDAGDAASGKDASDAAQAPDVDAGNPTYFRSITIHNNAQTQLPAGYTIGVAYPEAELQSEISSGKMRSDLNDLRVRGTSGERDRLVDAPPMMRIVWFSLASSIAPGTTDTTYAITYGVPNAPAPPADGANVFDFYDEFVGSAPDSHWITQGTVNVANGKLTLPQGGFGALTTLPQLPTSTCEFSAQITNPGSDPDSQSGFYYWFGFQHQGDFDASEPWVLWIARGKTGIGAEDQADGCPNGCNSTPGTQSTNFRLYSIERQPAQTIFTIDGTTWSTPATNDQALSLMIRNWLPSGDLVMDWIRSRTRIYPEPTVTLGAEQTQ